MQNVPEESDQPVRIYDLEGPRRLYMAADSVPEWAGWTAELAAAQESLPAAKNSEYKPSVHATARPLPRTVLEIVRGRDVERMKIEPGGVVASSEKFLRLEDGTCKTIIVSTCSVAHFSPRLSKTCSSAYYVSNVIIVHCGGARKLGELRVYPLRAGVVRVRSAEYEGGDGHYRITADGLDVVKAE